MAPLPETVVNPVTDAAFLADRQNFWASFCNFTTGSAIVAVVGLVLMLIFLV